MNQYKIIVSKSASKELTKLSIGVNNKIIPAIKLLVGNLRPNGSKKLKGINSTWRIRIGDYRVIYIIDDVVLVIEKRCNVFYPIVTHRFISTYN